MFSSTLPDTFRPVVRLGKFELVADLKIRPGEQSKSALGEVQKLLHDDSMALPRW